MELALAYLLQGFTECCLTLVLVSCVTCCVYPSCNIGGKVGAARSLGVRLRALVTWSCVGSISGLALALGGSGAGSPAAVASDSRDQTTTSSRAPSPPPNERQQHSR